MSALEEMKRCPACAESIQAAAKKCRFCNEWIGATTTETASSPTPVSTPAPVGNASVEAISHDREGRRYYWWLILVVIPLLHYVKKCDKQRSTDTSGDHRYLNVPDFSNDRSDPSRNYRESDFKR